MEIHPVSFRLMQKSLFDISPDDNSNKKKPVISNFLQITTFIKPLTSALN
jgi:hypothetical protein